MIHTQVFAFLNFIWIKKIEFHEKVIVETVFLLIPKLPNSF